MDRYYARRWTIWLDLAVLVGELHRRLPPSCSEAFDARLGQFGMRGNPDR
jgi:hypothetical protein